VAGDYVPHSEVKLVDWAERFVAYLEEHTDEVRLPPGELAAVRLEVDEFIAAHHAHKDAQNAARAACAAKDAARKPLVDHLRSLARRVRAYSNTSSGVMHEAEVVIGKSPRAPKLDASVDRPLATIDAGQRLRHVIRVVNERAGVIHKARPSDVFGCELWRQTDDDPDSWEFVDLIYGKPLVLHYRAEDAGKLVRYRFRWRNRYSETSAWSATRSATVAA